MDPDLFTLLRTLGVGAATWLATATVWVAVGLAGDARIRRRRAARLARRKAAAPSVPTFADPMSCRWCEGHHETPESASVCHDFRNFRRELAAWVAIQRHAETMRRMAAEREVTAS